MYNELIKLISETYTIDDYGNQIATPTEVERFAKVKSISQTEFYKAATVELRPEINFVMADYLDYSGQKKLKYTPYNGAEIEYSVLRVGRNGNEIELICERKLSNG